MSIYETKRPRKMAHVPGEHFENEKKSGTNIVAWILLFFIVAVIVTTAVLCFGGAFNRF